MCGIVGIYRKTGITEKDIEKFTSMLNRCEIRGTDATGMFTSNLDHLKTPVKASYFIKTRSYRKFIKNAIGCKYIVGHTRQATRGNPRKNRNNHPVFDKNEKIFLVHNGMLDCDKWDLTPKNTDTYIFIHCISVLRNDHPTLYETVKASMEDINNNSRYNSSVVVVGDTNEIVFCKSETRPLAMQQKGDALFFASTETILGLEVLEVKENGDVIKDYYDLNQHSIVGIDLETGKTKTALLNTYPIPQPLTIFRKTERKPVVTEVKISPNLKLLDNTVSKYNPPIKGSREFNKPKICSIHLNGMYKCYDCLHAFDQGFDESNADFEEWVEETEVYCTLKGDTVNADDGRDCVDFWFADIVENTGREHYPIDR